MRPLSWHRHGGAQCPLAAALDAGRGRLQQDREIARQQVGPHRGQPAQPVPFCLDFLAVIEDVADVVHWLAYRGGQPELDGDPGLHVGGAAAIQPPAVDPGRQIPPSLKMGVARYRHGVDVPGQDHPPRPAQRGPGHQRVPVPVQVKVRQPAQRRRDHGS
jgi:hypothetical protein